MLGVGLVWLVLSRWVVFVSGGVRAVSGVLELFLLLLWLFSGVVSLRRAFSGVGVGLRRFLVGWSVVAFLWVGVYGVSVVKSVLGVPASGFLHAVAMGLLFVTVTYFVLLMELAGRFCLGGGVLSDGFGGDGA